MKRINVLATYNYEIEIDEKSPIVKEYENEKELIEHLVDYRFTILPVIDNGVRIVNVEVHNIDIHKTN